MGNRTAISGEFDREIPSESAVPEKRKRNRYAFMCAVFASTVSILTGYGAAIFIKKHFQLSPTKVRVLTSVIYIYAIIGAAVAGRTSDYIGRRYTMVLAGFIFFFGAFLMGLATNYVSLMLGQSVIGLGIGYATIVTPVYIAEVSPTSSRGFFTSLSEVFMNFGMMLGYLSNFVFSKVPIHMGWRFMVGIGIFLSMFVIVVVLMIPESPRWLVMQGQIGKAKWVLDKTSDSLEEAERRLIDIKEANGIPSGYSLYDVIPLQVSTQGNHATIDVWKELFLHPTPPIRHILIVTIGLHLFQRASGITILFLYTTKMVEKVRINYNNERLHVIIAARFTKLIFSLLTTFLLDRIGRRSLLLTSVSGKMISLTFLGYWLTKINHHSHVKFTWDIGLCITTMLSDIAFFSLGGPIMWVYSSEILPTKLRAQGLSVGVIVSLVTSMVVKMTILPLSNAITIGGVFFFYAGISVMFWVFFYLLLPETQGRNLENMEELFGSFLRIFLTKRKKDGNKIENGQDNENSQI